jgi:hypothetical protein
MADTLEQDLGFEPYSETPQAETPQVEVPQVEQPQVETPPTEQNEVLSINDEVVPTVQPTTPTADLIPTVEVDESAILNKYFGTTDAESIKQQLSEIDRLKGEIEKPRYQSKFAEYIDNLVSKYGDPKSQADVFKKTIDILTTDADTLEDSNAVAFQIKQEYPSFSDEDIQTMIEGKYNLGEYATDDQKKFGVVQLKMDAQKAKLNIKQMQADAFKDVPSKQTELKQIDEDKRKLDWKPKSAEVASAINSFEFELEKGKKLKFDIPQADKAMLASLAEDVAVGSGWLPDSNAAKQVGEIVKMTYLYQNAQKLISNAYKKGLSQANAEWAQKVNNPSGLKNTGGGLEFGKQQKQEGEYEMEDIVSFLNGGK